MNNARYPRNALIGIFCFLLVIFINLRILDGDGKGWRHIVNSDGRGYYAYLPSLIIGGDPTFIKGVERESMFLGIANYKPSYLVSIDGHALDKYFSGEALLLLPFFYLDCCFLSSSDYRLTAIHSFFKFQRGWERCFI